VASWALTVTAHHLRGEELLTTRQAIVVVIIILAIATAFAAISVEVFGGEE
jgi:hypothetical protein